MEESRYPVSVHLKTNLILNNLFSVVKNLNVGDKGQMLVKGIIESEELKNIFDDRQEYFKTILVKTAEVVNNKSRRIGS
jgi:hypothetical protein